MSKNKTGKQNRATTGDFEAVFSLATLDECTMGDRKLQAEVLRIFAVQIDEVSALLTVTADAKTWRLHAHNIVGTAAALGAVELSALARSIEDFGPPSSADGRWSAIENLRASAERYFAAVSMHVDWKTAA